MTELEIPMRDLVTFCEDYNAIGYGRAEIIELKTKFIVELWNAGFSENEEQDTVFRGLYKIGRASCRERV